MRWLLLVLLLAWPAYADFSILNKPGQRVDVESKLVKDKENVVVFHSANYPVSYRMLSEYKKLGERRQDLAILIVDIDQMGSAVAKQYRITEVPYVRLYDKFGKLTKEGVPAYQETLKMISSP